MNKTIKSGIYLFFSLTFFAFTISSCTPVLVGGALVGGGYAGYKAHEDGYRIKITKEVKGTKVKQESSEQSDADNKGVITSGE